MEKDELERVIKKVLEEVTAIALWKKAKADNQRNSATSELRLEIDTVDWAEGDEQTENTDCMDMEGISDFEEESEQEDPWEGVDQTNSATDTTSENQNQPQQLKQTQNSQTQEQQGATDASLNEEIQRGRTWTRARSLIRDRVPSVADKIALWTTLIKDQTPTKTDPHTSTFRPSNASRASLSTTLTPRPKISALHSGSLNKGTNAQCNSAPGSRAGSARKCIIPDCDRPSFKRHYCAAHLNENNRVDRSSITLDSRETKDHPGESKTTNLEKGEQIVTDKFNSLVTYKDLIRSIMLGFDPNAPKKHRLDALPTTHSNAEGNRTLILILRALDSLATAEGMSKKLTSRLVVEFQRLGATLLEHHEIQEPKWSISQGVREE